MVCTLRGICIQKNVYYNAKVNKVSYIPHCFLAKIKKLSVQPVSCANKMATTKQISHNQRLTNQSVQPVPCANKLATTKQIIAHNQRLTQSYQGLATMKSKELARNNKNA